jgi:hypothetical protein
MMVGAGKWWSQCRGRFGTCPDTDLILNKKIEILVLLFVFFPINGKIETSLRKLNVFSV